MAQLRKVIEFEQIEDQIQNRYQPDRQAYNWEDYDYDIFWCEGSDAENKNLAAQMVGEMRAQGAKGRLRVRNLPLNVNARPGYGIKGYEIRRNYNEVAQATALMKLGNEILSNRGQFEIGLSAQDTRFYLSAFLCP